jgi:hypothetical protein
MTSMGDEIIKRKINEHRLSGMSKTLVSPNNSPLNRRGSLNVDEEMTLKSRTSN